MKIVKILSTLGAAAGIALSASCGSTGDSDSSYFLSCKLRLWMRIIGNSLAERDSVMSFALLVVNNNNKIIIQ